MGKKGGTSWLTAVKRAFRSPTKDAVKKNIKVKVQHQQDDEEEKKRENRRWLFRKGSSMNDNGEGKLGGNEATTTSKTPVLGSEQRHAIAVAAAAAEAAAVATANAAVEIMRLTRPSNSLKQHQAATLIQTSFRGFLARRALIALRGIVKLQALIRGQNVRKQAKMTLKCMQALLKVQARLRDQRARLSHDGGRRSMFAETTNIWESKYLQDIRERKSTSREGSASIGNEWSECPHTLEELEAILEARKEASFRRERSLASAFSQQLWDDNETVEERPSWVEKVAHTTPQWDTLGRGSTDKRDSIKTVEIDTQNRYTSHLSPNRSRKSQYSSPHLKQSPHQIAASLRQRTQNNYSSPTIQPPVTPSPAKARPLYTRPSSPRCSERSYSTANTPSLRSLSRSRAGEAANAAIPNYMAATESAKAKSRSQSAPRSRPSSRPSTPERDIRGGVARKRLSYPVPEHAAYGYSNSMYNNLRSPSFKSVQAGYVGMEQQSNFSFNTDSIGGELSPCSTTDLRRFLRK